MIGCRSGWNSKVISDLFPDLVAFPSQRCGLSAKVIFPAQSSMLRFTWKKFAVAISMNFFLWPSAKDQGITWVVVVELILHLVHFLSKRNLREKILPSWDSNLGPADPQSGTQPTELERHCYYSIWKLFTYFNNKAADLGPVLVDTCFTK